MGDGTQKHHHRKGWGKMDIRENKQIALLVCTGDPYLFSLRIHNFIIDLNKLGLVVFIFIS